MGHQLHQLIVSLCLCDFRHVDNLGIIGIGCFLFGFGIGSEQGLDQLVVFLGVDLHQCLDFFLVFGIGQGFREICQIKGQVFAHNLVQCFIELELGWRHFIEQQANQVENVLGDFGKAH